MNNKKTRNSVFQHPVVPKKIQAIYKSKIKVFYENDHREIKKAVQ